MSKQETIDISCKLVDGIQGDTSVFSKANLLEGVDIRKIKTALDFIMK